MSDAAAEQANHQPDAEVVELCSDLIRIDTTNFGPGGGPGERKAAEYYAAKLDEVGIAATIVESAPGRASLIADYAPDGVDSSIPPLLIHGHLDVVPAQAEDWTVAPFSGEVATDPSIGQECVWGRGAVDMKDFDAMVLAVLRARVRSGRAPRRPLKIVMTADEEAGSSLGAIWLAEKHPKYLEGVTEAIGEVGGFSLTVRDDLRLYPIQTAEKGMAWLTLFADGAAGHGSMISDDNAITELTAAVTRIGQYQFPPRITPSQRAFLLALSEAFEVDLDPDSGDAGAVLQRLGSFARMIGATMRNTANPTMLQAGYKHNVIPGSATAAIDGRFVPGGEEEFFAQIKELLGDRVRYELAQHQPAVETEFAGDLVAAMQRSLAAVDPQSRAVPYLMSGGTDAKGWHRLGIQCFGFSPLRLPPELDFFGLFHGVDERVPVESLRFGARVLDKFLDLA